ncbi:MAG: hypothetical protein HOI95_17135, partial [Chromatiales bacterium]|nr:hypothetical protein [Chromatiales bacterium]
MKRLIWTLLGAAVTIVALLAGLVWYATDAEVLSEQLASALERSTGRPVTIGGPAQLSFGARPTLRLSNVRVGVAQPLLVAGEVAVTLNPIALIQGQVHITKIDASGIRLNLDDAQAIGTQPSTPDLSLRIDEVHLENTEVLAGSATPWRVSNLDLHFDDAQHARFDVSMAPAGSAQSMQSTGSLRLESGLSGPAHIAARGSAFDAVTFRLEGGIQSLLNLSGLNAIVEMEGDLYKTNIKLASRVTGDNRTVQLSNIQGSVEGHKVTGMLRLHPRSTPFKVTGDLQLSALNLGSLGGGGARPTIPSNITADVRISTPKLSVHDRDFAPVSGHVRLHNSQLKIGRIRAGIAGGE